MYFPALDDNGVDISQEDVKTHLVNKLVTPFATNMFSLDFYYSLLNPRAVSGQQIYTGHR